MVGALHEGLRARQRQARVEPLDHGEVAIAAKQKTKLRKAERPKELGVAATRDVEAERRVRLPPPAQSFQTSSSPAKSLPNRTAHRVPSVRDQSRNTSRATALARSAPTAR